MKKEAFIRGFVESGLLTAIVAVAFPDLAFGASGTGTSIEGVGTSLAQFRNIDVITVPTLISVVAYGAAAAFGVSGALKLKEHSENPAQVKAAVGIGRLLAAGGLAALPYLVQTALDTLHIDGEAAHYMTIDKPFGT